MKQLIICKEDLIYNIDRIISLTAPARVIAVLKGDGYGLGTVNFARILLERGVDFFAVSELSEARALRNSGFEQDILMLSGSAVPAEMREAIELGLIMTIGSDGALDLLVDMAKEMDRHVTAHIKLDTGFGRFGFLPNEIDSLGAKLQNIDERVCIGGIYSHFSFSFGRSDKPAMRQMSIFDQCVGKLEDMGISFPIKHIANSCAALRFPASRRDAVRIGSAFLGRLPLTDTFGLRRIGTLCSHIMEIKRLPRGHNIGYADTFKTKRETTLAIIPLGYSDGFGVSIDIDTFGIKDKIRNALSAFFKKPLKVIINGSMAPIVGRIGMYNVVADVTGISAKVGDLVYARCNPILLDGRVERRYE